MPAYRFTGPEPEDFPAPPIARRLHPGDVIEVDEPVEHARLELLTAGEGDDPQTDTPAAEEPPASPDEE